MTGAATEWRRRISKGGATAGLGPAFLRLGFALASVTILVWWVAALCAAATNAPRFSAMDRLELTIPANSEVVLGRPELVQPSGAKAAELRHLRLRTGSDGRLLISRVAEIRGMNVEFGDATQEGSSERYEVVRGPGIETRLVVGAQQASIAAADGGVVVKITQPDGAVAEYRVTRVGAVLSDGTAADPCFQPGLVQRVLASVASVKDEFQNSGSRTLAILGGQRTCSSLGLVILAMPRMDPAIEMAIRQNLADGRIYISPLRGGGIGPVAYETRAGTGVVRAHAGVSGIEWPVAATGGAGHPTVTHFTAGRTRYSIEAKPDGAGGWAVSILPTRRIALFDPEVCDIVGGDDDPPEAEDCPVPLAGSLNDAPAGGSIELSQRKMPSALARMFTGSNQGLSGAEQLARTVTILAGVALLLALPPPAFLRARSWRESMPILLGIFLVLALAMTPELVSLGSGTGDENMDAIIMLCSMAALWLAATAVIAFDRPGGWLLSAFWFVLLAVVAIGSLSLFTMSAEGPNTDWERFFVKHKLAVLDPLPFLAIVLTIASPSALRLSLGNDLAGRPSWRSPVMWFIVVVVGLFVAWAFIGNQQGLFGSFQPVEAGKFAVVAFLGAALAQWLIRARLIAQAWFGLSVVASVLSTVFLLLLLLVPAAKSDYSPLIIIGSTVLLAGVAGAMSIGLRIREEERQDSASLKLLPVRFIPIIRDARGSMWLVWAGVAALATLGAWGLANGEYPIAIACVGSVASVTILALRNRRIHGVLAAIAVAAPVLAGGAVYLTRDLPVKLGLGVQEWSWTAAPGQQIEWLKAALGEGRRLPVERVMSWSDLRYGEPGAAPRPIELRDMDYHVMRSRAALAHAPCEASAEMTAAPLGIGRVAGWFSAAFSGLLGGACGSYPGKADTPSCSPASLKGAIRPHCVPVVQSDFAATYLAARHGVAAAGLLVFFQIAMAVTAFGVFLRLQAKRSRDPVETGADQAMALIALGCGLLFVMQWFLAWSNAFGLLPVMGQPMTLLSAATSHHLFMAIPAVLAIMVAIRFAGLADAALTFREPPRWRR